MVDVTTTLKMCSTEPCGIQDLPYELLVEIFTYLEIDDLINNIPNVCKRWRDAANETRTWRHLIFCPDIKQDNGAIVKSLKKMPKLQDLVLKYMVDNDALYGILDNCPLLRSLYFCSYQPLSCEYLRSLSLRCVHIEELCLALDHNNYKNGLEQICQMPKLKRLTIVSEYDKLPLILKPIADGCRALTSIDLKVANLSSQELAYLMEQKAGQLEKLSMKCWCVGECALPYISVCRVLKELDIECDCVGKENSAGGLVLLRHMKSIQSLTLNFLSDGTFDSDEELERKIILNVFRDHGMSQLRELKIIEMLNYKQEIAETIARYCPLLKSVHFVEVPALTDDSVHSLSTLSQLECLSLRGTAITDDAIFYLHECKKLNFLDLSLCPEIKEAGMKKLMEFSNLRILMLDYCNILGFPFGEITSKLKHLRFLSVNNCMNMDWKGLSKLRSEGTLVRVR
ncbi:uncharacterized protein [Anabrus simplex]|uniref:uncharacterized protein n=1 Tax=Anabrus simplex TaxID=316456 RepID=UPI0035A2BDF5